MTREKVKATSCGPMVDSTSESGKRESKTERAPTLARRESRKMENGREAERSDGLIDKTADCHKDEKVSHIHTVEHGIIAH